MSNYIEGSPTVGIYFSFSSDSTLSFSTTSHTLSPASSGSWYVPGPGVCDLGVFSFSSVT